MDKLVINEIQNAVDHPATVEALQAISELEIKAMPTSMMMDDHTDVEWVYPPTGAGAPAIYFINGIDTKTDEALEEASAIAEKFERPVGLIYNQTHGRDQDLVESAYDRSWAVAPLLPGNSQANKATRQLARLLYSSQGQLSLISHSQGCIISRNALVIANAYGSNVKDRLVWVAAGIPLKMVEVFVTPKKFTALRNENDIVAEAIGLQLDPDTFSNPQMVAHSFLLSYLPLITPEQLH